MGLPKSLEKKIFKDMAVMLRPHTQSVRMFEEYVIEAMAGHGNDRRHKARLIDRMKFLYRKRTRREYDMNCPSGSFNKKKRRWTNDSYWCYAVSADQYPRFYEWSQDLRSRGWKFNHYPLRNGINSSGELVLEVIEIDPSRIYANKRLQGLILAKAFWMMRKNSEIDTLLDDLKFKAHADKRTYTGALRSYILKKNRYRCKHCGSRNELEVDHVIPWSKGGKTTIGNARVLCKACNIGVYHLEQKLEIV